jgi:probable F420-dependent oxidoreductase
MSGKVFGIHLPSSSAISFREIISYARGCEDLGFDSVWVADHVTSGVSGGLYEPLTTLAVLSGVTDKMRLGTSVLIASLRNPVLLADIAGTIQETSGGRLILGIGVGWDQNEFENLGVPFKRRGTLTDQCLEIIRGFWKGEPLNFKGTDFTLKNAKIGTCPKQPPPIWIGGNSRSAIRRAAKYDAWFPTDPSVEEISNGRAELTRLVKTSDKPVTAAHIYLVVKDTVAEAERSAAFLGEQTGETLDEIKKWAIIGDAETAKRRISNYVEAGVSHLVFSLPYTPSYQDSLERVSRLVSEL